jgi:RNA polymerase sigma-70 factor (ECF subfamily)
VSESTLAARLTRAKKKIKTSNIPYRVPTQADLPERIEAVLAAVHLVFTTGHTAPSGADLMRRDLVERALELARMLRVLLPDDAGVAGLLALIVLTDARHKTRTGADGTLLLLSEQDRDQWDAKAISEGAELVRESLRQSPAGRFALMAAVAAVHAEAPSWQETDWNQILALYDLLLVSWPSPVVALNRAVALGIARGPDAGLAALAQLAPESQLSDYNYLASARADFLRQLDRRAEARVAYLEALGQCENEVERAFLERRLAELDQ